MLPEGWGLAHRSQPRRCEATVSFLELGKEYHRKTIGEQNATVRATCRNEPREKVVEIIGMYLKDLELLRAVHRGRIRHWKEIVGMEFYLAMFLWLLTLRIQAAWGQDQCYFPGGSVAEGHSPCSPSLSTSFCCPFGYTCFSNHICIVTDPGTGAPFQASTRGSCTEKEWDSSACGDFCLSGWKIWPRNWK